MTLGVGRLAGSCGATPPSGMEAYAGWYQADNYCNPLYATIYGRELEGFEPSAREVAHTGPFGDLPILIFSRDPDVKLPMISEDVRARSSSLQEGLKALVEIAPHHRPTEHTLHPDRPGRLTESGSCRPDPPDPGRYAAAFGLRFHQGRISTRGVLGGRGGPM